MHSPRIATQLLAACAGLSMARALDELHVPVTLVLDSGAAYILER